MYDMAQHKRINARIETDLERLVSELARSQGVSLSAIVVRALRDFCERQSATSAPRAYESFSAAGIIGCFDGGKDLSRNYKQELDSSWSKKWARKKV